MPDSPFFRSTPDPRLDRLVRQTVLVSTLLVLAVPMARGHSVWFGSLPLWLLGMPLLSLWALHRFRLPRPARPPVLRTDRRRHGAVQARRRPDARNPRRMARAA